MSFQFYALVRALFILSLHVLLGFIFFNKKLACIQKLQRMELSENGSCSEVLNLFQEAPSASFSSVSKRSSNHCASRAIELTKTEVKDMANLERNNGSIDVQKDVKDNDHQMERLNRVQTCANDPSHEDCRDNSRQRMKLKPKTVETTYMNQHAVIAPHCQMNKTGATGIPVPGTEGSRPDQTNDQVGGANGSINSIHPALPVDPKENNSSAAQPFPHNYAAFAPMMQGHCNQDAYRSSFDMSSTFSSMLVSTLLSNPAVHAAARLAASYWPASDSNTPNEENLTEHAQGRHIGSPPSMASIVAATVAAASAWWATQGLLPLFAPPMAFPFVPVPSASFPTADVQRASVNCPVDNSSKECQVAQEQDQPEAMLVVASSGSGEDGKGEVCLHTELEISPADKAETTLATGAETSDAFGNKKDRSSCGSNTPSSSDVEAEHVPEKQDQANDKTQQASCSNSSAGDINHRRFRSIASTSDSWKEVSEEVVIYQHCPISFVRYSLSIYHCFSNSHFCCQGRMAFDALFGRGKLPQSFSPLQAEGSKVVAKEGQDEATTLTVDLNKSPAIIDLEFETSVGPKASFPIELTHLNMKSRRTGFKPYKRCSVEAKENRVPAGDEVGTKRIRLDSEAST
jgi:MYB-related transcription factor LHY